jgi:hypothetical protein
VGNNVAVREKFHFASVPSRRLARPGRQPARFKIGWPPGIASRIRLAPTQKIKVKVMKTRTASQGSKHAALSDWRELCDGDLVNILKNAQVVAQGRVDEVSGSGGVLWILDDKAETQAFFKSDGVFVMRR